MQKSTLLRILYGLWVAVGVYSLIYIPSLENPSEFMQKTGILAELLVQGIFLAVVILFHKLYNTDDTKLMFLFAALSIPLGLGILIFKYTAIVNAEFLALYDFGLLLVSIFWGLWLFPLGNLVRKKKIVPVFFAYFLYISGVGYILASLVGMFDPTDYVLFEILANGETLFVLWALIVGLRKPSK